MATAIHYPNESYTIDALWTILNQQSESVRQALLTRLENSLPKYKKPCCKTAEEALAFVKTLSVKSGTTVPADENGIEALINEKYFKQ